MTAKRLAVAVFFLIPWATSGLNEEKRLLLNIQERKADHVLSRTLRSGSTRNSVEESESLEQTRQRNRKPARNKARPEADSSERPRKDTKPNNRNPARNGARSEATSSDKPSKSGGSAGSRKGSKPSYEQDDETEENVTPPTQIYEEGDLNIRFNKIKYPNGVPESLELPLTKDDYPITAEMGAILRTESLADAVVLDDDFDMHGSQPSLYVKALGGPPSYPNKDPNNPFWEDLEEVVDVQILRRANATPPFTLPLLWEGYDINEVADAVFNKYPGSHQAGLLGWLWKNGLEVDYSILPFRSNIDIVSLQFRFAYLNTWAIECVGAINFCIKWFYGRPRPEEVAFQIATGELEEGVPEDLKDKIMSMNLEYATNFTAYPNGSPSHPSWPAMHSAASAASFWLAIVTNLTPEQYCEALRVDYAVSYARTVAGVHYPTDNMVGLNLGQMILIERLPDHLAESYGTDPAVVREKIERMRFNWNDFNVDECSIAGVPIVA